MTALDKCLDFIEDPRDVDVIWHTMQDGRKELAALRARVKELEAGLDKIYGCAVGGIEDVGMANYQERVDKALTDLEKIYRLLDK